MHHCLWACVCLCRVRPSAGGLQEDKAACNGSSEETWRAVLFAGRAAAAHTEEISCSCQLSKVNRSAATSWHRAWATSTKSKGISHVIHTHTCIYPDGPAAIKLPIDTCIMYICVFPDTLLTHTLHGTMMNHVFRMCVLHGCFIDLLNVI